MIRKLGGALGERLLLERLERCRCRGREIAVGERRIVRLLAPQVSADIAPVLLQQRCVLVLGMALKKKQQTALLPDEGVGATVSRPTEDRIARGAQRLDRQVVPRQGQCRRLRLDRLQTRRR